MQVSKNAIEITTFLRRVSATPILFFQQSIAVPGGCYLSSQY